VVGLIASRILHKIRVLMTESRSIYNQVTKLTNRTRSGH
jgi:hypothetical protein